MPLIVALLVFALFCGCGGPATAPPAGAAAAVVDVVELSASDARARMAAGTLTARVLTQAYVDRIASVDEAGPQLNAVIELNPAAIADAEALDAERQAGKV